MSGVRTEATYARGRFRVSVRPGSLRRPDVLMVEKKIVRTTRGGGTPRARIVEVPRWYVTLSFGGVHEKLGVSARVARWLRGEVRRGK